MTGLKILLLILLTLLPISATAAPPPPPEAIAYHLKDTVSIPGDGRWDYLTADAAARRVYISHGTEVDVLDADSEKVIGKIDKLQGVHGIALAPALGRGFISDGKANAVVIFDLKTLKIISKVDTGEDPDAIVYEPGTQTIVSFNGHADNATVIDAKKGEMIASIPLGGRPEFAAADGKGNIYDVLEDKSTLLTIDAKQQKITERWPLAPCEHPSSLAVDSKNNRLFVGCRNQLLAVVNAESGKIISTLPLGTGVDATIFDPAQALIITSTGDGALSVAHEDTPDAYHVLQIITTRKRSRTLALDEETHRLFVPAALFTAEPAPTSDNPHPRPMAIPGSFSILVFDEKP